MTTSPIDSCCSFRVTPIAVGMLILLTVAQGCATLPDTEREMAASHPQQVKFVSADGPVSEATSDSVLTRLKDTSGTTDILQKHLAYEQSINADSPLVLGNKLTLLQNGPATYQAMFAAMREARDNIDLETYIFDDDEAGKQFSDLLLERQAAGVQVNVIHDSVGSLQTPASFFDRLRAGGINVLEFNPVNPLKSIRKSWRLNHRDHRKLLIVDGRIAFTGGVNISRTYFSAPTSNRVREKRHLTPEPTTGWRDTHIQIEGPVVGEFQKLFVDTWTRQKGATLAPKNYFPELKAEGSEIVRAIGSKSSDDKSLIYMTLMSAISHAESEVHITTAYFGPDPKFLKALTDAAQRGVDVKLVLPSYSDSWPIFNLGRSYYKKLLRGGVKIYERRGAVMHAKTICIDGVWSTIGSANLDSRSFLLNDEINAVILGHGFAAQMDTMFAADLLESEEITFERWKHRSWMWRLKERAARIGAYWL